MISWSALMVEVGPACDIAPFRITNRTIARNISSESFLRRIGYALNRRSAYILGCLRSANRFRRSRHVTKLLRPQKLFDAIRQILDPVGLGGGAALQQEVAVGRFLSWNRVEYEQRLAQSHGLRGGQPARLCDNQ